MARRGTPRLTVAALKKFPAFRAKTTKEAEEIIDSLYKLATIGYTMYYTEKEKKKNDRSERI